MPTNKLKNILELNNVLVHDLCCLISVDTAMKTSGVRALGRLRYQWDWDPTGWYYMSRKGEQVNMRFFIGTVEHETGSLNQIIIGPLAVSWGWAD